MVRQKHDIFSNDITHELQIAQLRDALDPNINARMSQHDVLRFLRARGGTIEKAKDMIVAWNAWRHTLLPPVPPRNLRFSPNICLTSPDLIEAHPYVHLLPFAHHGYDKEGRPIYWEKTGVVQSTFSEVKKHFTVEELLFYHVQSQEAFEIRLQHASRKFNKVIDNEVIVFDLQHLTYTLDIQSIWYIKQLLAIDQANYPERLYKLFIINVPWFFTAIFNIFKPCIDKRTADKFIILGADYLPTLEQYIDRDMIPTDMGGNAQVAWGGPFGPDTGITREQVEEYMRSKYTSENIESLLTVPEIQALNMALSHQRGTSGSAEGGRNTAVVEEAVQSNNVVNNLRVEIIGAHTQRSYVQYKLNIKYGRGKFWQVCRRYSEFVRLRSYLRKHLTCSCLPRLPPKVFFYNKSPKVVAKRMNGLGKFLLAAVSECEHMQREDLDKLLEFLDAGSRRICEAHAERPSILDEPVEAATAPASVPIIPEEETLTFSQQFSKSYYNVYLACTLSILFVVCLYLCQGGVIPHSSV